VRRSFTICTSVRPVAIVTPFRCVSSTPRARRVSSAWMRSSRRPARDRRASSVGERKDGAPRRRRPRRRRRLERPRGVETRDARHFAGPTDEEFADGACVALRFGSARLPGFVAERDARIFRKSETPTRATRRPDRAAAEAVRGFDDARALDRAELVYVGPWWIRARECRPGPRAPALAIRVEGRRVPFGERDPGRLG